MLLLTYIGFYGNVITIPRTSAPAVIYSCVIECVAWLCIDTQKKKKKISQ